MGSMDFGSDSVYFVSVRKGPVAVSRVPWSRDNRFAAPALYLLMQEGRALDLAKFSKDVRVIGENG
jgi:hypothetical protein